MCLSLFAPQICDICGLDRGLVVHVTCVQSRLYMLYYKCGGEHLSLYVHVIVCHYTYTVCLYIYIQSTSSTCRASLLVILIRMTKTWLQPVMNSPDKVSSRGVRLAAETTIPTTLSPNPKLNALNFSSPGYPRAFGIKATNSRRSTGKLPLDS